MGIFNNYFKLLESHTAKSSVSEGFLDTLLDKLIDKIRSHKEKEFQYFLEHDPELKQYEQNIARLDKVIDQYERERKARDKEQKRLDKITADYVNKELRLIDKRNRQIELDNQAAAYSKRLTKAGSGKK